MSCVAIAGNLALSIVPDVILLAGKSGMSVTAHVAAVLTRFFGIVGNTLVLELKSQLVTVVLFVASP